MKNYNDKKKELISKVVYTNDDPIFRYIEVNLLGFCNRKCDFCPVSIKSQKTYMSQNIFSKIIDELQQLNFDGFFIISGFSEPFLHPNLKNFLKEIRLKIPKTTILVNTNGDFLDKESIFSIVNLLDYLSISIYDGGHRFKYFDDIRKNLNIENKIYLKKRWLGFDKNNRGGFFKGNNIPINKPCYYPFYLIDVNWNGNIMFCPDSFLEENVLGNIEKIQLLDAWNSDRINELRLNMIKNKRIYPCNKCDVIGDREGAEYYEAWKKSKTFKNSI